MPSTLLHASRLPAFGQRRSLFAWALLASVCLFAAMAIPYYLGRVYTSDDLWAFHLPLRSFYADCLARGEPFDWAPNLFGGFYVSGEGQGGLYHPLHLALYRLLPLRAAFDLELLFSYPLMLAGAYFFLRRIVHRRDAAMFGALVCTFSGFNLLHFVHPNAIAVVAHIPWLLLAIDVAFRDGRRGRVVAAQAAVALLTASQILLGYPQYVWFSLVAELAYAAYTVSRRPHPFRLGGRWALFKTVGLLIAAVQLLPTIDMLTTSSRKAADAGFFQQGSLHPANVLQLIAPYGFSNRVVGGNTHEFGFYLGAAPLALTVWLLAGRKRPLRGKRLTVAALAFAAVTLLLALGQYGGLYALQSFLPLVNKFRFPARYLALVHLAGGCLAAIGFRELARQCERPEPAGDRPLGPLFRLVGLSWMIALLAALLWNAPWPLVVAGPALLSLAALLVWAAVRGSPAALVGLTLLAAVDLGVYGLSYAVYRNTFDLPTALATLTEPPPAPASANRMAIDLRLAGDDAPRHGDQDTLKGVRLLDGYAGLEPVSTLDYRTAPALRVASVAWVARSQDARKAFPA